MECPRCGRLPGNGHTEICALQGEIERLRATIERLREYARHTPGCYWWLGTIDQPHPCDCGYDELMAELEEGK